MADWQTISATATAVGTLVLAAATFSAVRSSNRSARLAEKAYLTGMRPLLIPSLGSDPAQKLLWSDLHTAKLDGGRALVEAADDVIYLALALRNVGAGIALLHGWRCVPELTFGDEPRPDLEDFRRLAIDLYIPPSGAGYWESAIREASDPLRPGLVDVMAERRPFRIDILYGDQQGGQRTISRFTVLPTGDDGWYSQVARHWNLDMPDPR